MSRQTGAEEVGWLEEMSVRRDDEVLLRHAGTDGKPTGRYTQRPSREERPVAKRWTQRPDGSTWGDFGDDDELGRINLITPEKVLQGVREVEAGISFCLSLPLDFPGGNALNQRRYPPRL